MKRERHRIIAAVLWCLPYSMLVGQPARQPYFEVASVKPVDGMRGRLYDFSSSGSRVRYQGYTVANLIMEAYNVKNYQVTLAPFVEMPAGGEYKAYDIEAKAAGDKARSRTEFRLMLQALLTERFKLQLHRAQKQTAVYMLTVDSNGPKLKSSSPDAVASARIGVNGRNQTIAALKQSTNDLARMIQGAFLLDRPVLDGTGLTGDYDFKLEATPQPRMTGDDPDLKNISIFTVLRQQLGLRLEARRAPIEVLVVDHIEKPSAN